MAVACLWCDMMVRRGYWGGPGESGGGCGVGAAGMGSIGHERGMSSDVRAGWCVCVSVCVCVCVCLFVLFWLATNIFPDISWGTFGILVRHL